MKIMLFTVLGLMFTVSAYGQVSLKVSVVNNKTGKPIANLPVILRNTSIGYRQVRKTNKQGKVLFKGLSTSGSYTATSAGTAEFYKFETQNITLSANKNQSITIAVTPKSTKNLGKITVSGNNSVAHINTVDAQVSSQLNTAEVENLPIRARDFQQALFRLPHVVKATGGFITAPKMSINDGKPEYTNYLIDGLDNNENDVGGPKFPIPQGFIQNISVLSSNYSAEYGQSVDGVVNVTTKSGTNNLRGQGYFETRPGPVIDASSPFIQNDQAQAGFQRYQGGFDIGGPIVKNKTFFFVDAEGTVDINDNVLRVPQLGFSKTLEGYDHKGLFSAKLDQNWNDNFHSSLRADVGLVSLERQGGGLTGSGIIFPSASYMEDRKSVEVANINTYHSSAFSSKTSLLYSHFYWNYSRPINPGNNPDVTLEDPRQIAFAHIGAPGFPFILFENTGQLKQKFIFTHGHHQIKVGGGIVTSNFSLTGGGNPNGSYTVMLTQQQINQIKQKNVGAQLGIHDVPSDARVTNYSVNLRSNPFGRRQNRFNIYAEDLWSVSNRLNLSFGVRYVYDNLSKGGGGTGDWNNIGPRFSFNYRLNNKSVIRGGYGRYFQKIQYTIVSDALEFGRNSPDFRSELKALIRDGRLPKDTNINKVTFKGPVSASAENVKYLQGPSRSQLQDQSGNVFTNTARILNPNGYKNPYSDQFELGYQRQLKQDLFFSVDLIYHRTRDLFVLHELNAPASPSYYPLTRNFVPPAGQSRKVRSPRQADAKRPVPILYNSQGKPFGLVQGDSLYGVSRGIAMGTNEGQSQYYAATIGLKKNRGNDNYSFKIFYTLSHDKTNTEGFNFRAVNDNQFSKEFGPSTNDRNDVLKGFFTYYPVNGLHITATTNIQSGQPVNRVPDASKYYYINSNGQKVHTTDLNGNGIGRSFQGDTYSTILDRTPGASRNSDRLPWAVTFDLSAQYKLSLGGDQKLEFRADVFNIFNAENWSGFQNDGVPTNQIQVGPASSGRFVQHAASPPRQFQFSVHYLF
ncbi:MAG TPA: TonB-dependent receptor [Balneolaceae bacterium]|nr:TonB-dependent receptor [Balneolaceae bacterium]